MKAYLYFRTYWGDPAGNGWSGRNILAASKMEMVSRNVASFVQDINDVRLIACVDRPTTAYREYLSSQFDELHEFDEGFDVSDSKGRWPVFGGLGGLQRTIELIESKRHSDDDIILLVEDDYLFAESGLSQWIQACAEFDGFVTPFDHPDRYIRRDDWFGSRSEVMIIGDRHWRECESTTSVVGGKYKFFRKTALLRRVPRIAFGGIYLQRLWGAELPSIDRVFYRRARAFKGVKLISPMPGLACHLSRFIPPSSSRFIKPNAVLPSTQLSAGYDWQGRYDKLSDADQV